MKSYDEFAKEVFREADRRLALRKKRAAAIRQCTFAVASMLAIILTGVFVIKNETVREALEKKFKDENIITEDSYSITTDPEITTESAGTDVYITTSPVTSPQDDIRRTTVQTAVNTTVSGTASPETTSAKTTGSKSGTTAVSSTSAVHTSGRPPDIQTTATRSDVKTTVTSATEIWFPVSTTRTTVTATTDNEPPIHTNNTGTTVRPSVTTATTTTTIRTTRTTVTTTSTSTTTIRTTYTTSFMGTTTTSTTTIRTTYTTSSMGTTTTWMTVTTTTQSISVSATYTTTTTNTTTTTSDTTDVQTTVTATNLPYSDMALPAETADPSGNTSGTVTYSFVDALPSDFEPGELIGETVVERYGMNYECDVYIYPGRDALECVAVKIRTNGRWLLYENKF